MKSMERLIGSIIIMILLFVFINISRAENYQDYFRGTVVPYIIGNWEGMIKDRKGYATQEIKEIKLKGVVAMDCPHQHRSYTVEIIYHLKYYVEGEGLKEEDDLRQYVDIWVEDGEIKNGKVVMWEVIY